MMYDISPEQSMYLTAAIIIMIFVVILWAYASYQKDKKATKRKKK